MPRLYVIPASPPCACVEAALALKGVEHKVTALPPVLHAVHQLARFGRPTVPAMTFGRDTVVGSRAILRRIEAFWPDPPLLGGPEVEEAERWGDEELQPVGRRLIWWSMSHRWRAMPSYLEGSRLPLPPSSALVLAPVLAPASVLRNGASDAATRAAFRALPHHLSRIDAWVDGGVLGGAQPNAADLQIFSVLRLLLTISDVAVVIERHARIAALTHRFFPDYPGHVPAGVLPASWSA